MTQHTHDWDRSYEFGGSTYRECSEPGCHGHQQWICALDRWSETFETLAPREREAPSRAASEASSTGPI
ncbi:MAG: hypothetical protein AB1Z67_01225 [Candidatus Limnocylindrales bacterium]